MRIKDVSYVQSETGEGLDHMMVTIAKNLKSKRKADTSVD